jgi:hypothetical protein
MDTNNRPHPPVVSVPVDELTVVLGLLGLLSADRGDDEEIVGMAGRAAERLQRRIAAGLELDASA